LVPLYIELTLIFSEYLETNCPYIY